MISSAPDLNQDDVAATTASPTLLDPSVPPFDALMHPDEVLDWRKASTVAVAMCGLVGLLESVNDFVLRQLGGSPRSWLFVLREELPWWLLWMAFMPAVLWLARTWRFDDERWRRSAVVHSVAGLIIAIAHGATYAVGFHFARGAVGTGTGGEILLTVGADVRSFLLRYLFMDVMTYCAAAGVYYSFEYFTRSRRSAIAAARSESQAARLQLSLAESRLHALRMELNPHFLFNALNAAAGLVRKREHDAAVDMLARLGELLRTTLNRDMPTEVPLSEELGLLRRFLEIELVRFGDRLRVMWEVEPGTEDAYVPPLILQPLVENALKHGISRRPGDALVRISARRVGLHLELAVRDSGGGLTPLGRPPREGIGLSNTRARLEQLYGPDTTMLELTDVADGGARSRLLLPFHLTRGESHAAAGD